MIIGGEFNKKCERLLIHAGECWDGDIDSRISVETLNEGLEYDRIEMRGYLEYLNDRGLITLSTIGGPYLYGHISITKKGELKLKDLKKNSDNS